MTTSYPSSRVIVAVEPRRSRFRTAARLLAASAGVLICGASAAAVADGDPYAPLRLYDGTWEVAAQSAAEKVQRFTNHCARTHLFFACEQVIDGKTGALLVFMPTTRLATGAQQYRTQALRPDASRPGEWNELTIEGQRWVFTWEYVEDGKTTHWRNTNTFTGTGKIHFEIESSDDGKLWKSVKAGDEARVTGRS
jgi:hypothetical protein